MKDEIQVTCAEMRYVIRCGLIVWIRNVGQKCEKPNCRTFDVHECFKIKHWKNLSFHNIKTELFSVGILRKDCDSFSYQRLI